MWRNGSGENGMTSAKGHYAIYGIRTIVRSFGGNLIGMYRRKGKTVAKGDKGV